MAERWCAAKGGYLIAVFTAFCDKTFKNTLTLKSWRSAALICFILCNYEHKYLDYLSSKLSQCQNQTVKILSLFGWMLILSTTYMLQEAAIACCEMLSFVFLLLTLLGLRNAEKCLFWLPLHDKDSTKQAFGSYTFRISYLFRLVLVCI